MRRVVLVAGLLAFSACVRQTRRPERRESEAVLGRGTASYYGQGLDGRLTASGERFDKDALTAAHRRLPFGTCVRVHNLDNDRQVKVRVNDRGPYAGGRIIDVSEAAARRLGMIDEGLAHVELLPCD